MYQAIKVNGQGYQYCLYFYNITITF